MIVHPVTINVFISHLGDMTASMWSLSSVFLGLIVEQQITTYEKKLPAFFFSALRLSIL
jgi:hypothetical protein